MTFSTVALKNVCKVESGAGFPIKYQGLSDQEFPFFKVGDMNSEGNEKGMYVFAHSISEEIRKKLSAKAFPAGTVIFPKIGAAIATNKKRVLTRPSCVDNNVMAIIPSKKVSSDYLFYLFKNKDLSDFANRGNPPSIRKTTIEEWKFPLPSLPEQKRIAAQLAQADRLRQLRRNASQLGESYLQSAFLEMFGDPATNSKKLKLVKFGDVCPSHLGKMLDARQQTGKHKRPYLRNINVQWNSIDFSDLQEMDFDEKDRKKYRLKYGDVLICEGGEVGRAAIWKDELAECYFQKALHRARPNPKYILPDYVVWLLFMMAKLGGLDDFTSQVTIAHLTGEKLKELEIPLPPLPEQERFAQIVARYEKLRAQMRESTRQAELLFQGLLALSFTEGLWESFG